MGCVGPYVPAMAPSPWGNSVRVVCTRQLPRKEVWAWSWPQLSLGPMLLLREPWGLYEGHPAWLDVAWLYGWSCPPSLLLPSCSSWLLLSGRRQEQEQAQLTNWRAILKTIGNNSHMIDMYLNATLDVFGSKDGLCQYKCSDGTKPLPCQRDVVLHCLVFILTSSSFPCKVLQSTQDELWNLWQRQEWLWWGVPVLPLQARSAETCREHHIPHIQACETTAKLLLDSVLRLDCKPYLDSQWACGGVVMKKKLIFKEDPDSWWQMWREGYNFCWRINVFTA